MYLPASVTIVIFFIAVAFVFFVIGIVVCDVAIAVFYAVHTVALQAQLPAQSDKDAMAQNFPLCQ